MFLLWGAILRKKKLYIFTRLWSTAFRANLSTIHNYSHLPSGVKYWIYISVLISFQSSRYAGSDSTVLEKGISNIH